MCLQIVQGHEGAANDLHRWLERTAYHKVPRAHQEEAVEQLERPFDLVSASCASQMTIIQILQVTHLTGVI